MHIFIIMVRSGQTMVGQVRPGLGAIPSLTKVEKSGYDHGHISGSGASGYV